MKPIWAGLAFALVACGSGDVTSSSTTATTVASTTTVAAVPSTTTTTSMVTTTLAVTTTHSSETTTTTSGDLPGEPVDFGPGGDAIAVIGVRYDDVLNLRAAPGADQAILDRIPPLYDGLITTGQGWALPRSIWIEVDYEGTEGWVNMSYVAYLGAATDQTDRALDALGSEDSAGSMEFLGDLVVAALVTGDPRPDVVLSGAPSADNPNEIVFDMVGAGDDSVSGGRLRIVGEPEGGQFTLKLVDTRPFCSRGLDDSGRCV